MRRYTLFLCFVFILTSTSLMSQRCWWVYFNDKKGVRDDRVEWFGGSYSHVFQEASTDSSDLPVSPFYVDKVKSIADSSGYASRWLNALSIVASPEQVDRIKSLPFVKDVVAQAEFDWQPAIVHDHGFSEERDPGLQLRVMQADSFLANGIVGKGVRIAVFDAGFFGTDMHKAFSQLRDSGRIVATYDFVDREEDVYDSRTDHGTLVLSCLAGTEGDQRLGMATGSEYLLAVIAREYGNQYKSEERFVEALEWAYSKGADIINVSGGPNEVSYFAEQMDGKSSVISRAANTAARKGILVVAAGGNNGDRPIRNLLPPAEADSVLSVTACDDNRVVCGFSSIGPPPDFRRKPDVSAPGIVDAATMVGDKQYYAESEGTSFSAPLVAGFAACLMQMYPQMTNFQCMDSLRHSAHLYPYYDYAHGYGVPQAGYFFNKAEKDSAGFTISDDGEVLEVKMKTKVDTLIQNYSSRLMYWNITDAKGRIIEYNVVEVISQEPVHLTSEEYSFGHGYKICVWYQGKYAEHEL